jgi:hypothetical protein
MIKNDYFLSQSFSNPTGWQQGGESGNAFVAYSTMKPLGLKYQMVTIAK